jgi:transposase-like protein
VPHGVNVALYIACVVAQEFQAAPTVEQLRARFGMSRATAYRWRRAWTEAQALVAARAGAPA